MWRGGLLHIDLQLGSFVMNLSFTLWLWNGGAVIFFFRPTGDKNRYGNLTPLHNTVEVRWQRIWF